MPLSPRATGTLAAVVTVALWTGFIIVGRASVSHTLLPFDLALVRLGGAAVVTVPWALWLTRRGGPAHGSASLWGLSPLPFRQTAWAGLFGGLLYSVLCYAGFFYAPAAHASVLMPGSLPLWAGFLAVPLLGERLTRARLLALGCIAGGGLVVGGASLRTALTGGEVWKGDLIFVSAAFCWSMYGVLARRFAFDAVRATIAITAFGALCYVPFFVLGTALGWLPSRLHQAPWSEVIAQALFQGLGLVVLAGITFVVMIRYFGPVRTTMLTALVPGLSALGAVALLGEPLGWNLIVGLVLVTAGILLGVKAPAPARGDPALQEVTP